MKWRTLIPALGLVAATLALPGTVEASHRHSRSCGHGYSGSRSYGSGSYGSGYYGGSYGSSYSQAPYYRTDYYYAPPPPPVYYYRPYYRPSYRPYYRPSYRPYYRPTSHFSFGIRW